MWRRLGCRTNPGTTFVSPLPVQTASAMAFGCAGCGGVIPTPRSTRARCPRRQRTRPRVFMNASENEASEDNAANEDNDPAQTQMPLPQFPSFTRPAARARRPPLLPTPPPPAPPPAPPPPQKPVHMPDSPVIRSLALNLRGIDALPSEASLMRYMQDLRPKLDYLGPRARERVLSALEVANVAHEGQKRKSGEPYIIHPIAVAAILADLRMDRDSIIAGLLHDTVEDTPFTLEEIEVLFGADVRKIVEGETKISKLASKVHGQNANIATCENKAPSHFNGLVRLSPSVSARMKKEEEEQEKQADNLRGMFLAMTEDVRVIIVKLADRLHNMRTLEHMKPEKQRKIAKETLEFFAPLAHRLGMRRIKSELEELSFRYLYPKEYRDLSADVESIKRRSRFDFCLRAAEDILKNVLEEDRILYNMVRSVEVIGSTKELYAIHKRRLAGESLSSMLDVANLCVVVDLDPGVDSNHSCYHVLGRIHEMWKPLPKRFKDYIAFPKPNGYQSLHTTVLLGQKHDFFAMEIQIRTKAMHRVAEEGIAAELFQCSVPHPTVAASGAHPAVASDDDAVSTGPDAEWRKRTQGWLISIRDYIDSFSSSRDLVDAVRRDLLGNRVFVFTPKGRIIDLPKDCTPVDLAYRIHTDVGHKMIGARVNGNMVPLDYKLQNADVVKIIGSNSSPGPSSEWMGYARSRTARQRIRQFLRARDRDNMLDRGRVVLENAATERGYPIPSEAALTELIPRLSAVLSAVSSIRDIKTVDDLYIAIAKGVPEDSGLDLQGTVLSLLRDRRHAVIENSAQEPAPATAVEELADIRHLESATCCHPVRGDEVMGIRVSSDSGKATVVHRLHCDHLLSKLRQRPVSPEVVGLRWAHDANDLSSDPRVPYRDAFAATEARARPRSGARSQLAMTARVVVVAHDCDGLLSYVSGVLSAMGRSIRRAYTATDAIVMEATLAFEVLVEDVGQLKAILERIEQCEEVLSARRVGPNEGLEYFPPQLARPYRPRGGGGSANGKGKGAEKTAVLGGQIIGAEELEIDEFLGDDYDDVM